MAVQAPKGTKDMLPQDSYMWQWIESEERKMAALAGFREIRTPVFEHTELFLRGVGDTTDIVQKEMYTFKDKGDRSITLKPEGTAGAVRALIENQLYADALPCKVYYVNNPVFRYEKPQNGRLREHHQFGMECFGAKEPTAEAELISLLMRLLTGLGLDNLCVHINSIGCPECRAKYHEALKAFLGDKITNMCETCRERFERNPLRVLDCKVDTCKEIVKDAPSMIDYLCDDCRAHFEKLQQLLTARGIPFEVDSRIVRGLDYYTKTVFEIIMQSNGTGLALCGGGRYDGLVKQLGGPETHAVGFGIGTERIIMELKNRGINGPEVTTTDVFVANLTEDMALPAYTLTEQLRDLGVKADMEHTGRKLKGQFKFADKTGARFVVIMGGEEYERGNIKLRDMQTKEEKEIPLAEAAQAIKALL